MSTNIGLTEGGSSKNLVIGSSGSGPVGRTRSFSRGRPIALAVISGLAVGVLLAAGAALLAYGGLTGSLPFMIAGGAAVTLSVPLAMIMILLSIRAHKMGNIDKFDVVVPQADQNVPSPLILSEVDNVLSDVSSSKVDETGSDEEQVQIFKNWVQDFWAEEQQDAWVQKYIKVYQIQLDDRLTTKDTVIICCNLAVNILMQEKDWQKEILYESDVDALIFIANWIDFIDKTFQGLENKVDVSKHFHRIASDFCDYQEFKAAFSKLRDGHPLRQPGCFLRDYGDDAELSSDSDRSD